MVSDPEDRIFNRVISDISIVLTETTLSISDSIETISSVESEMVRVVSSSTTAIVETSRVKKTNLQCPDILTHYQTTNFRLFQTDRVCRRQFQI